MKIQPGKTYIRNLRVRSPATDRLRLQTRYAAALSSFDLHPPNLSLHAILVVRHARTVHRPFHPLQRAMWEGSVRANLEVAVREAARPGRGENAAGANVILFNDETELLAAIACDFLDGLIWSRWWWPSILGTDEITRSVQRLWQEHSLFVPAAMAQLADAGRVLKFARALADDHVRGILSAVSYATGGQALQTAFAGDLQNATGGLGSGSAPLAPWQHAAPEALHTGVSAAREALIGLSLMAHRAPHLVASSAFLAGAIQWAAGNAGIGVKDIAATALADTGTTPSHTDGPPVRTPAPGVSDTTGASPKFDDGADGPRRHRRRTPAPASHPFATSSPASHASPAPVANPILPGPTEALPAAGSGGQLPPDAGAQPIHANNDTPIDTADALSETSGKASRGAVTHTAWGGVLYLVNVGLRLGIYSDFTTPRTPGIALPIWDFMAMLAERIGGSQFRDDPLWSLLSALSGRRGRSPGEEFDPPGEWRIAADWLAPFRGERPWRWTVKTGRMLVMHPAGFYVVDVPWTTPSPDVALLQNDALAEYRDLMAPAPVWDELLEAPVGDTPLARWMGWLAPYVRMRLAAALDVEVEEVGGLFFRRAAKVYVSATHLDAVFRLDDLPIEIRRAGLDRNPGWVPAAGRVVAFHYE